jgi:multiple sugar transport system ATP-binding protein
MDLYLRPNSRFVAGFIGSPQMNFLPATVSKIEEGHTTVTLRASRDDVRIERAGAGLMHGQAVMLGVRPEHIALLASGEPEGNGPRYTGSTLTRTVSLVERLGEQSYLHCSETDGATLLVKLQGNTQLRSGEVVQLVPDPTACHLFTEEGHAV